MSRSQHIESPCISVCVLDEQTGYCKGCLRTRDEIAAWGGADFATKLGILDSLRDRRAAAGGGRRRETRRARMRKG